MAVSILHAALPFPIRNARYSVMVPNLSSTGLPTDPTGTIACTVSIDAAGGAASAETPVVIATFGGGTVMTFSSTEMNCSALFARFTNTGATSQPTLLPVYPRTLPIIHSGTLSTGGTATVALQLATAPSYSLIGAIIRTTAGLGGVAPNGQAREITAYDTSTKIATLTPALELNTDNTTTYDILDPTQANLYKPSENPLWEGTLSAVSATTLTLPANHNISSEAQLAIILKSGTAATGKQRFMVIQSGNVYTVDPPWTNGGETTPSATVTAEVYSVAKAPINSVPAVNVIQQGGVALPVGAIPSVVAGNAGGLFIAGANAATSTPYPLGALYSGTATAGSPTALTFQAGASAVTGFYNGQVVVITGGTGVGQSRFISAYNGATLVATVGTAYVTTPDATSVYRVYAGDNVSAIGAVTGAVGSVTGNVGGNVVGSVGSVTGAVAGSVASVTGAVGSVTGAVGSVTGNVGGNVVGSIGSMVGNAGIKRNAALNNFSFVMTDSTTHLPKTGVVVTAQRSLDGGVYGACANAVVEVSAGSYVINLAASDTNAVNLILKFTGTASDTQFISITTGP